MGYKINAIFADAQSKVDVAINEMTRLYDQEKVDLVAGVYSSAQCVPMAQQADSRKKFLWLNVCVASSVMKDKKFTYVFRPTVHSDQYGNATCGYRRQLRASRNSASRRRTCASRSSTRTGPTAPASPRRTRSSARRTA